MLIHEEDELWLHEVHPGLVSDVSVISGSIRFRAVYRSEVNLFRILADGTADPDGGLVLDVSFNVRIRERNDKSVSALPAVFIEGIEADPARHMNKADGSACLCSAFEEDEFLRPKFQLRFFLERLVIPFLYAQVFYSEKKRWPWFDYAHGATGLLQSYSKIAGKMEASDCVQKLAQDRIAWPRIKAALRQKPYIKGHTLCFCGASSPIRRCHPDALQGALRLQKEIRDRAIPIP